MDIQISKEYEDRIESIPNDEFRDFRIELCRNFEQYKMYGKEITDEIKAAYERLIFESTSLSEFDSNMSILHRII